jgi:methyl-accepting chemotaxis protein
MITLTGEKELNEKTKKIIGIVVASCITFTLLLSTVFFAVQSYRAGRLYNTAREQLDRAISDNRELTSQLEELGIIIGTVNEEVGELGAITERNIKTAREAVEVIEELRIKIMDLERSCGSFDWDSYYDYYDTYFKEIGLMD